MVQVDYRAIVPEHHGKCVCFAVERIPDDLVMRINGSRKTEATTISIQISDPTVFPYSRVNFLIACGQRAANCFAVIVEPEGHGGRTAECA